MYGIGDSVALETYRLLVLLVLLTTVLELAAELVEGSVILLRVATQAIGLLRFFGLSTLDLRFQA